MFCCHAIFILYMSSAFDYDQTYYKILDKSLIHHGFQYQIGLNVDTKPFNPHGECEPGGLYFTDYKHIGRYFAYGSLIAKVKIPHDVPVYAEARAWKAPRLIIESYHPLSELEAWKDPIFCLAAVKQNGFNLRHVKEQTPELCMAAVQEHGCALRHVKEQSSEICRAAVNQTGQALEYVKEQTPEICIDAIHQDDRALQYIQTDMRIFFSFIVLSLFCK